MIKDVSVDIESWGTRAGHDILVIIDGMKNGFPSMELVPQPHVSDKQYAIDNGENWWGTDPIIGNRMLHDEWTKYERGES